MCAMVRTVTLVSPGLRARGALAALTTLVLLAGCSTGGAGGEADAASASSSDSASATPTKSPERDAPLSADQACAAMYVDGDKTLEERIGTALVGASDGLDAASADQMHAMAIELGRLERRVPEQFKSPVEKIRAPFLQLQETLDLAETSQVELDIASTVEGLKEYEKLC
jgi:hypothetical protein